MCCHDMRIWNDTGAHPIGEQVLVRRLAPEHESAGGIHLPNGSERWPDEGTVLEVGTRVKATELIAGVRVLFKSRANSALIPDTRMPGGKKEWERVVMLREDDVLCILEGP